MGLRGGEGRGAGGVYFRNRKKCLEETFCDLTQSSGEFFGVLIERARREELPYAPIQGDGLRGPQPGQPAPLNDAVNAS